jgi:regulator-associated protein of mTOR
MQTTDDLPLRSGPPHPNPLALHAPARLQVNGMAADAPSPSPQLPPQPSAATPSRPGTAATVALSTRVSIDEQSDVSHVASNGTSSGRPGLLRARSDFGPRRTSAAPESTDEGSVDGHFKIRHGWDDQLNSEEYSNLLTSVRSILNHPESARG